MSIEEFAAEVFITGRTEKNKTPGSYADKRGMVLMALLFGLLYFASVV